MPVAGGPFIQKTGILLEVDSADKTSYSGTGTTWVNQVRPGTYNGTLNNISFDSADSKGALIFTGSNTYVDFGNLGSSLTSSFSFQVAFKPAATASGQPYTILSYASASATSSYTFKLDYTSSNQTVVLTTFSNTGSQNIVYTMSASANSGSWNIVHGTFGSALAALYVNGLGQAYAPTTGSTVGYNTSNRLYAGLNYGSTVGYYSGSLANITVNNADLDGISVNKNYNAIASRFGLVKRTPPITDADAFAFVEVAGITDPTQQTAVNTLVIGLKTTNLWTKMQVIYPFVGGTAYSHKFNLKDPRNLDAAYRIIFSGAITHNAKGIKFDGTSYGDTRFAPLTALTNATQSNHITTYVSGADASSLTIAGNTSYLENGMGLGMGDQNKMNAYTGTNTAITITTNDGPTGLAVATRIDPTNSAAYIRGSVTRTITSTLAPPTTPSTRNVFVGKENGAWNGSSTSVHSFASLGTGLTTTDVENLYTVVQAYNTSLNRAFNQ
jgi:hypothetical protein